MCYFKYISVRYEGCGHAVLNFNSTHECQDAADQGTIFLSLPVKIILRESFSDLCVDCK